MRRPYYYGVDLIRFFAAIAVLIFHLGYLNQSGIEYRLVWPLAWQGWVGVEIFFVVSGLVIANSAAAASPIGFLRGSCDFIPQLGAALRSRSWSRAPTS
jgi:exopolysaccharide production protein ExoZ